MHRPMDNLDAIVGQRSEPALTGENTTMTTYVGASEHLLLAIGDASYAPNVTRFGLQAAVGGIVKAFQQSQALTPRDKLIESFAVAANAVEAAKRENQYTSPTGAGLTVAVVHANGVCVGRLGGGRVHLMVDGQLHALFEGPGLSFLGSGSAEPEISEHEAPLKPGDKVIVLSEQAYGGTLGQLPELTGRKAPQLAAVRIVEAARRRGQRESLAALVLQLKDPDSLRGIDFSGPPATSTGPEGHGRGAYRSSLYGPPKRHPASGLIPLLIAAFIGGGLVALTQSVNWGDDPAEKNRRPTVSDTAAPLRVDIGVYEPDVGEDDLFEEDEATSIEQPLGDAEGIHAIFIQEDVHVAARALKRYARGAMKRRGKDAFRHLTQWFRTNKDTHSVNVLEAVLQRKLHFKLRRWVGQMLAEMAREALNRPEDNRESGPTP